MKENNEEYYDSLLSHRFAKIMRQATNAMHILRLANMEGWRHGDQLPTLGHLHQLEEVCGRMERAMDTFEAEIIEADKAIDALLFKDKELYEMGVDTHLWYLERNYQKNPQDYGICERWLFHLWKWLRKDRIEHMDEEPLKPTRQ